MWPVATISRSWGEKVAAEQRSDEGSVRLGVDFGISATVIAVAGPGRDSYTLEFPGISREFPASSGNTPVHFVPSFVEYRDGRAVRVGEEVLCGGTADSLSTARWLRRYLCDRSPVQVPAGNGRMVRYDEAAADFLIPVLAQALGQYSGATLIFTLPPDAPAKYAEVLQRVARTAGGTSCSTVSEYEAVLAGYGCVPPPGEPFVIITFSETDPGVIVLVRDGPSGRVMGEDGLRGLSQTTGTVGCRLLDTWITQDLLLKLRLFESDPQAVRLIPQIRYEAARLRENLALTGGMEVRLTDTVSGKTFTALCTTADLDRILADHEVILSLQECIGRALSAMRTRDGDESRIRSVFLLGAGCALPAVQDAVRSRFPDAVMYADHPLDAIARGAAVYTAPSPVQDRITCSYALRYWDPAMQEHHYRFLVHSGTRYPSAGQVARIIISAAYDGQALLGIPLYEIGGISGGSVPQIELVSDAGGGVRLAGPAQDAESPGQVVHANERSPTLLVATPPARKGEPRFECTFTIDPERNLCLSARDLVTGTLVKVNAPVHRMK
jgi:molecular chaperone DnaK (HSP70)